MSDEIEVLTCAPPIGTSAKLISANRVRCFELALVLTIAVGLSFLNSLLILRSGPEAVPNYQNAKWSIGIFHEITALLLLGYVLWRRNRRIRDLGLNWSWRNVGMGLALAVASYVAYSAGYYFLHSTFFATVKRGPLPREVFGHFSMMAIPFSLLNPFFEELIVRAYLMTEVKDLTGSWLWAAVASTVVQTSYHLYYGWEMALSLGLQFLVFSIYYARTRKATPLVIAHGLFDTVGLLQLM